MSELKFKVEFFESTVPTGTLSRSISQVNAAYNLAATKFVKQWIAFHDRGIKTALAQMAKQVSGSAIDKLAKATGKSIDIRRQTSMNDLTGCVILRPVGLLDTRTSANLLEGDGTIIAGNLTDFYNAFRKKDDIFFYYNGLGTDASEDDTLFFIQNAESRMYMRNHKVMQKGESQEVTSTDGIKRKEMRYKEAGMDLSLFTTCFSLVKGNLYQLNETQDAEYPQGNKERNLWDDAVIYNNWAQDLPERVTLSHDTSDSFKRDSTMFEAMRLDLVKDELRTLFAALESKDLAIDFDAEPFPFEERLHTMNENVVKAKLTAFSFWVTQCLFDKGGKEAENIASKEIWEKAHEKADFVEIADFDHIEFSRLAKLLEEGSIPKEFQPKLQKELTDKTKNGVYFSACEKQVRPETFPYVLPLIDLSVGNNLVWGSTITPFLLSVIAVASALSNKIIKDGPNGIPIKSWLYDPKEDTEAETGVSDNETEASASSPVLSILPTIDEDPDEEEGEGEKEVLPADEEFTSGLITTGGHASNPETIKITQKELIDYISGQFKGFHFSNRKALNNGVYSVLFMETNKTNTSIKYKNGDENVELLVNVNGRSPIDISKVSESPIEKSILAWMYYYIHGFSFPHLETGRKMTGLIEPYCVLIKGPTYSSLATEMQCGNFYYATAIMIALESEACQLLGHISRDNKKRKRDQSFVVADYFVSKRACNFQELDTYFKTIVKFKFKEFASALVRLVRAIKSFNDCLNDAGKTTRDRVVMGRIDGERMVAAQEVLYGKWIK